jgi:RNA polymerase sigma-70 factor (ECF subfamily)
MAAASLTMPVAPVGAEAEARPPGERAALERLRRGDPDALGAAYDRHHVALRAFARRLVGDQSAAEDLVQEVFVTLPSAIHRLTDASALGSFLISIAINHARHHLRAAARRRSALERLGREERVGPSHPDDLAARGELATALVRALDRLPLEQRVAFVLLEVEERSSSDAAAIVGVPEATMRTRLFHARRRLREHLAAEGHDDHR